MSQIIMRRHNLLNLPEAAQLPPDYRLRPFNPSEDDPELLASTLSAAFGEPWDVDRVKTRLTEAPDVKAVYIVTWQVYTVATASSRWLPEQFPDTGYVHWVATHPDHTRKGLSSALMAHVLQDFLDRGYQYAVLETDDSRIPAIKTYLKFGFIPVYEVNGEDQRQRWSDIFQTIFKSTAIS